MFAAVSTYSAIGVSSITETYYLQLRFHVSGEREFKGRTAVPSNNYESTNACDDKCDWVGEYYRLRQLFHEKWNTPGMQRIAKAIYDVAFGGLSVADAQRTTEDLSIVTANQRNAQMVAIFGTVSADTRTYISDPNHWMLIDFNSTAANSELLPQPCRLRHCQYYNYPSFASSHRRHCFTISLPASTILVVRTRYGWRFTICTRPFGRTAIFSRSYH
jgi:hypothetical protein